MNGRAFIATTLAAPLLSACAGATIGSGVGERLLTRPPYYAGRAPSADTLRIPHLRVAYQPGGSQDAMFDPPGGPGTPVAGLLRQMNALLDSLQRSAALEATPSGTPPDVSFGCQLDAVGDCVDADVADGDRTYRLAMARPSTGWSTWLGAALDASGHTHALAITLEVGQYWPRQRNLLGQKVVDLGTGYSPSIPWLTSLETPVTVLQVTGALVNREGRAVRIGAEGIVARPTNLLVSGEGGQRILNGDDVDTVRAVRRDDLPGAPLAWRVALETLVRELTGAGAGVTTPPK